MSLWSLSSFIAFTDLRPRVVIHDDGTLTNADRDAYNRAFQGIEVLDPRSMDAETHDALAVLLGVDQVAQGGSFD